MIFRYNLEFYMTPVHATKTEIVNRADVDVLSLDELKSAYIQCAEWLHARGPYIEKPDPRLAIAAFQKWRGKVVRLLDGHCVNVDQNTFLYCSMNAGGTGKTHVSFFERLKSSEA
jgi:hypothetical protein